MAGRTIRGVGVALATAGLVSQAAPVGAQAPATTEQRAQRYQIGMMERVLENAVEHGASVTRDRLRAVLPAEMLLSDSAQARGFRLQGYGVFFDVVVPSLEGMLPWVFRTLDRTDLGLDSALQTLRTMVERAGDADLRQALRRVELQVAPFATPTGNPSSATTTPAVGSASTGRATPASAATGAPSAPAPQPPADPILANPEEAYRAEVMEALMDAMLDYSRGLGLAPDERLTVGARRSENPRLGLGDGPARTIQISLRGADLQAFLQGSITREDARERMDVRVF